MRYYQNYSHCALTLDSTKRYLFHEMGRIDRKIRDYHNLWTFKHEQSTSDLFGLVITEKEIDTILNGVYSEVREAILQESALYFQGADDLLTREQGVDWEKLKYSALIRVIYSIKPISTEGLVRLVGR